MNSQNEGLLVSQLLRTFMLCKACLLISAALPLCLPSTIFPCLIYVPFTSYYLHSNVSYVVYWVPHPKSLWLMPRFGNETAHSCLGAVLESRICACRKDITVTSCETSLSVFIN